MLTEEGQLSNMNPTQVQQRDAYNEISVTMEGLSFLLTNDLW
jgi:hypothetical protein